MTTTFPDISISTDRLTMRPLDDEDATALADLMNDELVTTWLAVPHPYTLNDALHHIRVAAPAERAEGRGIVLAVTEFLTQRLVGVISLGATDWRLGSAELSYTIGPWARGEGYACEAALAVAQWAFRDQRLERLELRTAAGNTAAQQVAQKIGCISEGVLRNAWIARSPIEDGGWADTRTDLIVWGLLPEDIEDLCLDDAGLAEAGGYPGLADWNALADRR
ncbi:GNAT family N-acetyltransferase [Streptomyces sp. NPDC060194]|uniref:GNAT family N-acetyltransferase n=1 Tax=Streptomyces sp. NPDC060194 TaxID=3347069 RepID=UPI00364F0B55